MQYRAHYNRRDMKGKRLKDREERVKAREKEVTERAGGQWRVGLYKKDAISLE